MEFPTEDQYSNVKGFLRWIPGENLPIRMANGLHSFSMQELETAETVSEFHCQNFDLSVTEDLEKYSTVSQRILDGWYSILDQKKRWDEDSGVMHVWMEWTQNYLEIKSDGTI